MRNSGAQPPLRVTVSANQSNHRRTPNPLKFQEDQGMRMLRCIFFLAVLLLVAGRLFAQAGATGTILGTVTDATGAIVPGVKVTVTNVATNAAFQTVTSSSGDYNAPSLN